MLLENALDRLVARHEILRTRFERLPGMEVPVQVIGRAREGLGESVVGAAAEVSSTNYS